MNSFTYSLFPNCCYLQDKEEQIDNSWCCQKQQYAAPEIFPGLDVDEQN